MDLPKFTLATRSKMVATDGHTKNEHTKDEPTLTDDNMSSTTASAADHAGPSQRPQPTFVGLPIELKKLIVHHAEDSCLANLRLTSKELNAITIKPFGERLLAERRFMLSEHSLKGLIKLTAHPDFGPCVRKVLLSTHIAYENFDDWHKSNARDGVSERDHRTSWRSHTVGQRTFEFSEPGNILDLFAEALHNLKTLGHPVTLGIFDDVIHDDDKDHDILRKAYGFDKHWGKIAPYQDLAPKQWLPAGELAFASIMIATHNANFPLPPLELDLRSALRGPHRWLDILLCNMVMTKDHELKRNVDVSIRAGLDWKFRFFSLDAAHRHLIFEYQGTIITTYDKDHIAYGFVPRISGSTESELRYDYGSGTCSLYSQCMLGQFNNVIDKADVSEIRISSCATEADRLIFGICHIGQASLQRLVLVDLHLFGHGCRHFIDEKVSAWPYLTGVRSMLSHHCPKLRSLVMERVYYHVEDTDLRVTLVDQRREWKGVNGVLSGLTSLISEMTMLDEEQRERWSNGEIDADGNDRVEDDGSGHAH